MKKVILIILVTITCFACSKNDENSKNEIPDKLIGKWKITEIYSTDGGSPATWSVYDSGEVYDIWFKENQIVSFTGNSNECMSASYSVIESSIYYTNNPCTTEDPIIIELLNDYELILDLNNIEPYKSKYIRVID